MLHVRKRGASEKDHPVFFISRKDLSQSFFPEKPGKNTLTHFPVLHKKKEAYHSLFITIPTDSMKHFPDDIHRLLRRRQRFHEIETGRIQFADPLERFLIILIAQDDHRNPGQGRITLESL